MAGARRRRRDNSRKLPSDKTVRRTQLIERETAVQSRSEGNDYSEERRPEASPRGLAFYTCLVLAEGKLTPLQ